MTTGSADQRSYRLTSIDLLRGAAIVLMAIDHVRDFFLAAGVQDPMTDPNVSPALFATRWVTHFCAPVFLLLAGTSAGLMAPRKTTAELSRFLLTRGLWLIFIEWFVISTAFTFAPGGMKEVGGLILVPMQVIWAIGASMVVLAGAQYLGRRSCLLIGAAILIAHNLLDPVWPPNSTPGQFQPLWVALHAQMSRAAGPWLFRLAYPLIPWIGVMLFGFGIAGVFEQPPERRNAVLLRAGVIMVAAFAALRALDLYGDPHPWQPHAAGIAPTIMAFLNTSKYPPSLLYLLMTLGPAAILCSFADRMGGPLKTTLVMFGRVPFAFYVAHFYLIHLLSVLLGVAQGFDASQMMKIFFFYPKGYGISLGGVYVVWLLVLVILYPFCRWVAAAKARRRDWWLSYL